ncbi:hypothetical protein L1987_08074 [Smallanthus sonchifolius]|uniref:Uncharacterized protein n=1 Tax=Smallanthus sonchifolius TaxID=185202 RepID=A0ACB9JLC7_9ASTR|nr:hypothetical protein L1987_08074 [Smallanthus sonchifolius]
MLLIMLPDNRLHLYMKKGKVGADPRVEERVEEWKNVDDAIKEFVKLFEELTGNEFGHGKERRKSKRNCRNFSQLTWMMGMM